MCMRNTHSEKENEAQIPSQAHPPQLWGQGDTVSGAMVVRMVTVVTVVIILLVLELVLVLICWY